MSNYDERIRTQPECFYCHRTDIKHLRFTWSIRIWYCEWGFGCRTVPILNLGEAD